MRAALALFAALILAPLAAEARCENKPLPTLNSKQSAIEKLVSRDEVQAMGANAADIQKGVLRTKMNDPKDAQILMPPYKQIDDVKVRCEAQLLSNFAQFLDETYSEAEIREIAEVVKPGMLTTSGWTEQTPTLLGQKYSANIATARARMVVALDEFKAETEVIIQNFLAANQPAVNTNPFLMP